MKYYIIILVLFLQCWSELCPAQDVMIQRFVSGSSAATDTTNWYVSNTGSDSNSGNSTDAPLLTITGLMTKTLQRGDTVFFKRGDKWREQFTISQSGTADSNIVITAYGTGADPIISGSELLNGTWVQNGSIWATHASADVYNLFVNGTQQVLARSPNIGQYGNQWFPMLSGTSTAKVKATGLTATEDALVGGTIVVRAIQWAYEREVIRSNKDDSVSVTTALGWTPEVGWGCFAENKQSFLDSTGEMWHNTTTDSTYWQPPAGQNPSSFTIEGSELDYGITTSQSYIKIYGIQFKHQRLAGINISGTPSNITIRRNTIWKQLGDGVKIGAATAITIDSNTIRDVNAIGINAYNMSGTITDDTLRNSGTIPGSCEQPFGYFLGDGGVTVKNCYLDSIGYDGIYAHSHVWIEGCIIKHYCMSLTDGGAIYSDGHNVVALKNFCYDGVFFTPSNGSPSYTTIMGVYDDAGNTNSRADSNMFIRSGNGGFFTQYNADYDTCRYNMFYNITGGQWVGALQIMKDSSFVNPYHHVINNNTFFHADEATTPLYYQYDQYMRYKSWRSVGTIDYNTYYNPYGWSTPFRYEAGAFACLPTFQQLKDSSGQEANSTCSFYKTYSQFTVVDSLFVNETNSSQTFTIAANSWKHPTTGTWNSTSLVLPAKSCSLLIYDTDAAVTYDRDTVTATNRDAYSIPGYEVSTDEGTLIVGEASGNEYEAGVSFKLDVPKDATIDSARVYLTTYFITGTWNSTDTISIKAYAVDNNAVFVDGHEHAILGHATMGTDSVAWVNTSGTADVANMSPDIKTIIQTLVNRASWASGNYIGLTFDIIRHKHTAHQITFYSGEIALATAPRIIVYYH